MNSTQISNRNYLHKIDEIAIATYTSNLHTHLFFNNFFGFFLHIRNNWRRFICYLQPLSCVSTIGALDRPEREIPMSIFAGLGIKKKRFQNKKIVFITAYVQFQIIISDIPVKNRTYLISEKSNVKLKTIGKMDKFHLVLIQKIHRNQNSTR